MNGKTNNSNTSFWKRGEPLVWLSGAALTSSLLIVIALIGVVMYNGLGYFWPSHLTELTLNDGTKRLGVLRDEEVNVVEDIDRILLQVGNREQGPDFVWIDASKIAERQHPAEAMALERTEYGSFFGYLDQLDPAEFETQRQATAARLEDEQAIISKMNALSYRRNDLTQKIRKLTYHDEQGNAARIAELNTRFVELDKSFEELNAEKNAILQDLADKIVVFHSADGTAHDIKFAEIVRAYRPNSMGFFSKVGFYFSKVWELLWAEPREANTEGGLFPAIFGTVVMVFMMSLFCIPMGIIAAVYLREYAREGLMVRLVRIAVNNLAGVPSIVYGVFGLGFFIYGIGSTIDRIFFPERLPTPTWGTGGILWASLTLALLTVPVVIVATEEALAAIPRGIREGSLALGATKFQTLFRILLPMASPGIMTGLVLAMARAAGEVAPLMIVGVVKLAPSLPIDGQFPFFHLDRKFMHLGFHIFDVGFQSPNVEAAKPMVYVTTLLLVVIVILMSGTAIYLRNKMQKRYTTGAF